MLLEKFFGLNFSSSLVVLLVILVHHHGVLVTSQKTKASPWQTLTGDAPAVVARGGFSGLFPDSSLAAYQFAPTAGSPNTTLWCDVQLSKDGVGFCLPDVLLNNSTNINFIYPHGTKDYLVNGVPTTGWFAVDYNSTTLSQEILLMQGVYSRIERFNGRWPPLTVEDVTSLFVPPTPAPALWLNIQHNIFYSQHNLSMRDYVLSLSKRVIFNYLSSPEVGFLSGIAPRFKKTKTKLFFRFLEEDLMEPSTNQTYGSLLKNLTFIKTFASGILVPKHYIWPLTSDLYLQTYTSIVMDAHKAGLEIFAGDFANDAVISYNYSYSPLAEHLSFIDNGVFSVDGVLTDFPTTPTEAIEIIIKDSTSPSINGNYDLTTNVISCFSHLNKSSPDHGKPIIISHYGASGDYPECTDLAYQKAVDDGADIIDCPVQVTSDRVLVCMSSINLLDDTTVAKSRFSTYTSLIPEIQDTIGIFTFNLTLLDIQTNLKPLMINPESEYRLVRNTRYANAGNFTTLSDFLTFAKGKGLSGVLITIENAAFMVEKLGFDVTNAVITALNSSGYSNQTTFGVTIKSSDSAVLVKFKQQTKYNLMYEIDMSIRDAGASTITDIKKFADSVAIDKESVYPASSLFITEQTNVVSNLQKGGLQVYVYILRNEFVSQAWDYLSDPIVEITSFVQGAGVDGVITDFPGTARAYKSNSCANMGNDTPSYMWPVQVGFLISLMATPAQPPALAPFPILEPADVVEPALPPASKPSTPPGGTSPPSSGPRCITSPVLFVLLVLFVSLLLFN